MAIECGKVQNLPDKADADTDHNLVRMKFKLKLHKVNKARPKPRYDFSERDKFKLELRNRFELLDTLDASDPGNRQSAETEWQTLKAAVTGAAAKTLSKKTRTVKKEWIKPHTFALMEEKRPIVSGIAKGTKTSNDRCGLVFGKTELTI